MPAAYTLKNTMPYVDDDYPSLVFLVPKPTARQWRFTNGQTPTHALMGVAVQRGPDNSLLLLDLPLDATLRLRRRDADPDTDNVINARVRCLHISDTRGRCAEIDVVVMSPLD